MHFGVAVGIIAATVSDTAADVVAAMSDSAAAGVAAVRFTRLAPALAAAQKAADEAAAKQKQLEEEQKRRQEIAELLAAEAMRMVALVLASQIDKAQAEAAKAAADKARVEAEEAEAAAAAAAKAASEARAALEEANKDLAVKAAVQSNRLETSKPIATTYSFLEKMIRKANKIKKVLDNKEKDPDVDQPLTADVEARRDRYRGDLASCLTVTVNARRLTLEQQLDELGSMHHQAETTDMELAAVQRYLQPINKHLTEIDQSMGDLLGIAENLGKKAGKTTRYEGYIYNDAYH
jgi:hypothetical protein